MPESMLELVQSMSAVGTATFRRSQYAEERGYRIPTALFTRSAGYLTPTQQLSVDRKAWLKPPSTRKDLRRGGVGTYRPLNYRRAARTLFLRPYLAHFCPVFSRFFAVFSVLTPGFQKVAPKDRGAVP